MDMKIDKNSIIPIGVQLKEQFKMFINTGIYKEGEKLPSINRLADLLEINKNTVVAVLSELELEGYIKSFRGKGVFVNQRRPSKSIDPEFLEKIDFVVEEARRLGIKANDLINLVGVRFSAPGRGRDVRALLLMGISRDVLDFNLKKLRDKIPDAVFEGLFLGGSLSADTARKAFERVGLIIIPTAFYEDIKERLPEDKPVVKTSAELKDLESLRKGTEKKAKTAVISMSDRAAGAMAELFVSSGLFRPKLTIAVDDLDKHKKELKEIDTIVSCISAQETIEGSKLKGKALYCFSDYINEESIKEIKQEIDSLKKT